MFLGFGYAGGNIERLQLQACLQKNTEIYLWVTGFTDPDMSAFIRSYFNQWLTGNVRWGTTTEDIVALFRRMHESLL
jgi:hypothetical protein